MLVRFCCSFLLIALTAHSVAAVDPFHLHRFESKTLSDTYYSEGISAGDLNSDGHTDVVIGPYWFAGPSFADRHEIYPPVAQNRSQYADQFFTWVYDFDEDGNPDILSVGFPGTPAYVYQNPGAEKVARDQHWTKHQVLDWVSNESPQLIDIIGEERPELVCTRDGFYGFATIDTDEPLGTWTFHPVSQQIAAKRFGHGLGAGDIDGDGRQDILHSKGWFEQPAEDVLTSRWRNHAVSFSTSYGGAEMHAYDIDGDGDNDVITSEAAHDFGLSWYEQFEDDGKTQFRRHRILGSTPAENRYGVVFSELHSVALADINGDGLKDIVTGKTYYSHHQQSPMWDADAVVYWFELDRNEDGIDWIPHLADREAGIGRQIKVADVNEDELPDILTGGMKGAHLLTHQIRSVDRETWLQAQPQPRVAAETVETSPTPEIVQAKVIRGAQSPIDPKSGRVAGAIEGEAISHRVSGGSTKTQGMDGFPADRWSNNAQLWWTGGKPGDQLQLDLPAHASGNFSAVVEVVLTCASDYGIVQLLFDEAPLGEPIDCYSPRVETTGVLKFAIATLAPGKHTLSLKIVGTNPQAKKSYMAGVDYVRLVGENDSFAEPVDGVKPKAADGRVLNLDFETGSLADWTATGDAFSDQPVQGDTVSQRRSDMRSRHRGDFWIGGFEKHGDDRTGTLTSQPFVASEPYASFLVAGGDGQDTRVELINSDTREVFYRVAGNRNETLQRVVVNLSEQHGQPIQIRLVDEKRGAWGHINFDHFRLHATRPEKETPSLAVLVPDEYPHAGLAAEQAAAAMDLPDGFHVSVGAAEPAVQQPIAMALDARGRVWIAEAYEYPTRAEGKNGRDRILIFEDTDNDGTLDHRKVFAEGLNLVSGLEVGFGGVWVGAAPYLLFIPDRDGDDVPDGEPEILLDGWGYQDTHETLNTFTWGPDGWLYGCHGVFTHSRVGKPAAPDEQREPINAGIWRYHPTRHVFEVFAHGTSNPWGIAFDDHGEAFITACVIPHLFHVIQGARYQRQAGQHFNQHTYRDIVTIADHLHYLGSNPHRGNNKSDQAGGGHAHAGAMIYLGGTWPEAYRGKLFMNNIHGQRLNVDALHPQGSGYVGTHEPDFLLTGDQASQILNLRHGPDGNVWMIDWYDMQACHRPDSSLHDRSNGRIYKISYGESENTGSVDLTKRSDRELAELVLHQNDWFVRHSRRLLQERAATRSIDAAAIGFLSDVAANHADDTRVLRAVWTLHVTGNLTDGLLRRSLQHSSEHVRGWTIRLLIEASEQNTTKTAQRKPAETGERAKSSRAGASQVAGVPLEQLVEMAQNDPSPVVRRYLASAAMRLPLHSRWDLLTALCSDARDADDHNLPLLIWYAAEPLAEADPQRALAFAMTAGKSIPLIREFMLRRIGGTGSGDSLAVLVDALGQAQDADLQSVFLTAIRASLEGQRQVEAPDAWPDVYWQLMKNASEPVRLEATALGVKFGSQDAFDHLRQQIGSDDVPVQSQLLALDALLDAKDPELLETLLDLAGKASPLRSTAIRGLGQYDAAKIATTLVDIYDASTGNEEPLTAEQKRLALGTLSSRPNFARTMLQAIEAGRIPATDLTADLVRQLIYLEDETIDELLASVWGTVKESPAEKIKQIAHYKAMITSGAEQPADPALGRAVFSKTCMNCHQLYGAGYKIGPDLTGSNRANLDYLLSNIVDPSAVMAKEYQPTVVLTVDGRVVTGLLRREDANSLTLQTSDSLVTIPIDEIEDDRLSAQSMMPEDQLRQFSDHEIRSLFAYLQGKRQVPMLATEATTDTLFNGQDLAGWSGADDLWSVENGQIVGRTDGLDHNEWLVSDLQVGDFRLSLDVMLVENQGNSGIQFRSKVEDGHVSGYQADVGPGWWGKLYEEHGRGLLAEPSSELPIKPGQWNQYEIEARGERIRTWINGELAVDLKDPEGADRGILALQLHSGGPMEVRFRNLDLKVLDQTQPSSE